MADPRTLCPDCTDRICAGCQERWRYYTGLTAEQLRLERALLETYCETHPRSMLIGESL